MKETAGVAIWAFVFSVAVGVRPAAADVIYTNIGTEPVVASFPLSLGGSIDATHGDWFVPSVTGTVGSLEAPLATLFGLGSVEFWLTADAGRPGEVLDVFRFESIPASGRNPAVMPIVGANSTSRPLLTAGTRYWILGVTPGFATEIAWGANQIDDRTLGQHYWRLLLANGT
jgi:hypothetical protein